MPCYRLSVAFSIDVRNNADVEALIEAFRLMPEVVGVERQGDELAIATVRGPARALVTEGAVFIEGRLATAMEKQLKQCFAAATQAAVLRRKGFTVSMRRERRAAQEGVHGVNEAGSWKAEGEGERQEDGAMVEVEMEIDAEGNVTLKASRGPGEKPVCVLVQQLISALSDSGADVTNVTMDNRVHGHHHDFEVRRRA